MDMLLLLGALGCVWVVLSLLSSERSRMTTGGLKLQSSGDKPSSESSIS